MKIFKENTVKKRRKLFEENERKPEEFLKRKGEPKYLKKWKELEKGKEREVNLELKNSPARIKLAKSLKKKENLKKLAKSGELSSLFFTKTGQTSIIQF